MYELAIEGQLKIVHRSEGEHWTKGILHDHELGVRMRAAYEQDEAGALPPPFGVVQELLAAELALYDNQVLNEPDAFEGTGVLFEDLARVLYEGLRKRLPDGVVLLGLVLHDRRNGVEIGYRPAATLADTAYGAAVEA